MENTMVTDLELERKLAEAAGHQMGCFEERAEELLEEGIQAEDIYQTWLAGSDKIENCRCLDDGVDGYYLKDLVGQE